MPTQPTDRQPSGHLLTGWRLVAFVAGPGAPALLLAGGAAWFVVHFARAPQWPSAQARVVEAKAVDASKGCDAVELVYAFEVGATRYTGGKRTEVCGGLDKAQAQAAAQAPGTPLTAYYDPTDPADSSLNPDEAQGRLWLGAILAAFAAFLGFTAFRIGYHRAVNPHRLRPWERRGARPEAPG